MIRTTTLSGLVLLLLLFSVSIAFGQTASDLQERMRERLPQIDALKKAQVVGENRKGLLEALEPVSEAQQGLIRDENTDRKKIYQALAAQNRATVEQVGIVRARQIAERSAPGVMVEDARGRWVEKE